MRGTACTAVAQRRFAEGAVAGTYRAALVLVLVQSDTRAFFGTTQIYIIPRTPAHLLHAVHSLFDYSKARLEPHWHLQWALASSAFGFGKNGGFCRSGPPKPAHTPSV